MVSLQVHMANIGTHKMDKPLLGTCVTNNLINKTILD